MLHHLYKSPETPHLINQIYQGSKVLTKVKKSIRDNAEGKKKKHEEEKKKLDTTKMKKKHDDDVCDVVEIQKKKNEENPKPQQSPAPIYLSCFIDGGHKVVLIEKLNFFFFFFLSGS